MAFQLQSSCRTLLPSCSVCVVCGNPPEITRHVFGVGLRSRKDARAQVSTDHRPDGSKELSTSVDTAAACGQRGRLQAIVIRRDAVFLQQLVKSLPRHAGKLGGSSDISGVLPQERNQVVVLRHRQYVAP